MHKNWFIFISGVICLSLYFSSLLSQPGILKKDLNDGVKYYYRNRPSQDKPWFFQQVEGLLNVLLQDKTKLPFGKSVAFLVGVSQYASLTPQLPFVKNDIEDMRNFLFNDGGFDEVYVAQEGIVDRKLIDKYLLDIFRKQLKPADRLLFYYAGHGADLEGETGYMQFSQARSGEFYDYVMKISDATDWCIQLKNKHLLVIFDCCASGLAIKSRSSDAQEEYAQMIATLSKNGSRAIITAGTAAEKTFEVKNASGRGNGVFTRAFLNAVTTGRADQGKDGFITIDEIMAQLKTEVAYFAQKYKQNVTPQIWPLLSEMYRGTFVFLNPEAKNQNCKMPEAYQAPMGAVVLRGELVGAKGTLELTAFLTGKVLIDEQEVEAFENGDIKSYDLLVGRHQIAIRSQSQTIQQTIEIKKGQTTPLTLRAPQKSESPVVRRLTENIPTTKPTVQPVFRMQPATLSNAAVKRLLQQYDFYCEKYSWNEDYCNPTGKGFVNQFEPQTIGKDKVVFDRASGLMWQQGGSDEYMFYKDTEAYIKKLKAAKFAGFDDWRLPTLEEAMSLMEPKKNQAGLYIDDRFNAKQSYIWTADEVAGGSLRWVVYFHGGSCSDDDIYYNYVRLVRSGHSYSGE